MLNHNQIVALKPTDKTFKKGLGNGLTLLVDKQYKGKNGNLLGGRKYFKGKIKGTDVWLGTFGNKGGELSLKNAREKYFEIKDYCHQMKFLILTSRDKRIKRNFLLGIFKTQLIIL
tara:strand:+ start:565 stop:912 length:348 start_codon:yes stop_codon:yes gene_type:complete